MSSFHNSAYLSIIIVNYNSKEVLLGCLRSIVQSNYNFEYEVIIIDNASNDNLNEIELEFSKFIFIHNADNVGFAAANNIGIRLAKGKHILLLNPDTFVNNNSLQPMIKYLDEYKDVAIVGCKIFNADGEIERSTHSFPSLLKEFMHANEFLKHYVGYESRSAKFLKKIFKSKSLESYWDHNSLKEVDHVTGACMMVKKEAIDKVGLLDEAFFLYNEEVEWSYSFKKAGYKSVFLPDPSIIHLFGYATKQRVQKQTVNNLLVERYRGMFYFFKKHYGLFKLLMLRFIVLEGFSFRLIGNYLSSLFLMGDDKRKKYQERLYMMKIIGLIFKNNFDWRFKD